MAIASPIIQAEMADWVRLGGGNSGIVGDAHRPRRAQYSAAGS